MKFYVVLSNNEELRKAQSRILQEAAFKAGLTWVDNVKIVQPYLDDMGSILVVDDSVPEWSTLSYSHNMEYIHDRKDLTRMTVDAALEEFAKPKPLQFKPGDWIAKKAGVWTLIPVQHIRECKVQGKELSWTRYNEHSGMRYEVSWSIDDIRLATDDEVISYLEEQIRVKYPRGTTFKSVFDNREHKAHTGNIMVRKEDGNYWGYIDGNGVYASHKNPQWAVIVNPGHKLTKIGNHAVGYTDNRIIVGCLDRAKDDWIMLHAVMRTFDLLFVEHADGTRASINEIKELIS